MAVNVFEHLTHRDFLKIEHMLEGFVHESNSFEVESGLGKLRGRLLRLRTIYELLEGCEHFLSRDLMDIVEFLLLSHWRSEIVKMRRDVLKFLDEVEVPSQLRKFNVELGKLEHKIELMLEKVEQKTCI